MFILLLLAQFREFGEGRRELVLKIHKFLDTESGLLNDGTQGSFGDVSSVMEGNGRPSSIRVLQHRVASRSLPDLLEA